MSLDATETEMIVRSFVDAWNRRDKPAIQAVLADDAELVTPPSGGGNVVKGRDNVAAILVGETTLGSTAAWQERLDLGSIERSTTRLTVGEGVVLEERRFTAKTSAGDAYVNPYVFIYEFDGPKIARVIEHTDTLARAKMLGEV